MTAQTTEEQIELANLHQQAGQLQQAEQGYRKALAQDPENPDAYNGLGLLAMQIGQYDVAEELLRTAVELAPGDTTFLCNLGTALYGAQQLDAAQQVFRQALEADEHCAAAYLNLGIIAKARSNYAEAAEALNRAVTEAPRDANAFAHLADALIYTRQFDSAENIARAAVKLDNRSILGLRALASALLHLARPQEALPWVQQLTRFAPGDPVHYRLLAESLAHSGLRNEAYNEIRKALALAPDDPVNLATLAGILTGLGKWDEARIAIDKALALDPDNEQLVGTKANILELCGEKEQAFALIKPIVETRSVVSMGTLNTYLTLARRLGHQEKAAELAERVLSGSLKSPSHYDLYFTAGQLYDDLGAYDKAFDCFERGNRLKPRAYEPERTTEMFEALMRDYTPELFRKMTALGSDSLRPIFIVGMPRSGTSLTEQILASHPAVFGAGELRALQNLADALPEILGSKTEHPRCLDELTRENAREASQRYLDFIDDIAPESAARVTDKMPQNFVFLGLIALLFPNARIIHCNRNAIDVCLSCYFQNFAATGLQFSYAQESLGHYYRLYRRLMDHWRKVLPMPIYELHYERLTAQPEAEIRKLLEFCDLEWDDACLDHTRSGIRTVTASYDQVRRPIYTNSVQRWKRYERHIQPLIKALGSKIANESVTSP